MPINGGLYYAKPENMYSGLPVDEIKALNKEASQQYSDNRAAMDKLDVLAANIDVREQDAALKHQAIDRIRQQFSQIAKSGNYQDAEFVVNKAAKDFETDQALKGAILNRKKELDYYSELNKRAQEGKIDQDDYARAVSETKRRNDRSMKYNPETFAYEDMFQGVDLLDSKAKDIYDNAYKRIEGWKEGSIMINGVPYVKESNGKGGYIISRDGVEVDLKEVYDALTTEIKNRPEYMDYINQKKDTDLWKRFTDPRTGQRVAIGKDALIRDFDLSEDEVKSIATQGKISQGHLDQLLSKNKEDGTAKSKEEIAKDKELYRIQKAEYDKANLDSLTPQEVEDLYGQLYTNDKVKDFAMPAAEKAAYQKFDTKYREDKFALEAYKHKLDKDLEKYKQKLANPVYANVENTSVAETIEHKDLQDTFQSLYETNKLLNEIEGRFGKDPLQMPKDIANQYTEAKANKTIMEASKSQMYEQMKNNGYDIIGAVKNKMFDQVGGNAHNEAILTAFMRTPEMVNNLPVAKAYNEYRKAWEQLQREGKSTKSLSFKDYTGYNDLSEMAQQVKREVEANPNLSKYLEKYVDASVDTYKNIIKPNHQANKGSFLKNNDYNIDKYGEGMKSFYEIGRLVEDEEESYFEDKANKLIQLNTSVISADTNKDYTGEQKGSDPVNKYISQWNDLLHRGTEFKTMSGKTPQEFVDEYNEERNKNKEKAITVNDLQGSMATKVINGKYAFIVALPNGQSKIFFPERQDEMARSLKDIGERYLSYAGDQSTQQKGVEILSQVDFAGLKKVIPDAHLNNRKVGDIVPIDIPIRNGKIDSSGPPQKFGLQVSEKLSNGSSIVKVVDKDGNSQAFDQLFSKVGGKNEFNSMDELMYNLEVLNLSGKQQQ